MIRVAVFALCLAPAAVLGYRAFALGDLGVNPVETLTHDTGQWALRLLLASLAVTPLRRLTGWNRLIALRRPLGLFAFFYAVLHLSVWVVFDHYFTLSTMAEDVAKRPFITAGTVALLAMVPLAATSTRAAIGRLGRRWVQLHRLVYVSAVAAVLHFIWKEKVLIDETMTYAAVLAVLLGVRVVLAIRKRGASRTARSSPG